MGDRVYVTFAIRGRIETVEALDAICESLVDEGLGVLAETRYLQDEGDAKDVIYSALAAGESSVIFYDEQCNYADLSALEATCKERGVSYQFEWEAGCEFNAGATSFTPEHGDSTEYQNDALGADIIRLLELPDAEAIAAIRERVAVADLARNESRLPKLSASDAVLAHLREWESEDARSPAPRSREALDDADETGRYLADLSLLLESGFIVGKRDPRLNTDYPGAFMVVEPHEVSELPTRDGANGPWCIVGDDLDALIAEAAKFVREMRA